MKNAGWLVALVCLLLGGPGLAQAAEGRHSLGLAFPLHQSYGGQMVWLKFPSGFGLGFNNPLGMHMAQGFYQVSSPDLNIAFGINAGYWMDSNTDQPHWLVGRFYRLGFPLGDYEIVAGEDLVNGVPGQVLLGMAYNF